jgi:hypothetical protein
MHNKDGWIQLSVKGTPYEIGYQHGSQLKLQLAKLESLLKYEKRNEGYHAYIKKSNTLMALWQNNPEWAFIYDEIRGISEGSGVSTEIIFAWNMLLSLDKVEKPTDKVEKPTDKVEKPTDKVEKPTDKVEKTGNDRCSAFIWSDGANIIMGHNTHSNYSTGFYTNVVMHVYPTNGYHFVMQTAPGLVCSSADWFITEAGIIGCETTLAQTEEPVFTADLVPYFFRIRKAMEHGTMMDDYVRIMSANNAGDYGCQWLLGNINTGHIMQLELTLSVKTVTMLTSGYFVGANMSSWNPEGINTRNGARYARLLELVKDKTSMSVSYAKKVLADHYDVHIGKTKKGYRSICSHKETGHGGKQKNAGAVDGKVVDSAMAKNMQFWGRMGSSCGLKRTYKKMSRQERMATPRIKLHKWNIL